MWQLNEYSLKNKQIDFFYFSASIQLNADEEKEISDRTAKDNDFTILLFFLLWLLNFPIDHTKHMRHAKQTTAVCSEREQRREESIQSLGDLTSELMVSDMMRVRNVIFHYFGWLPNNRLYAHTAVCDNVPDRRNESEIRVSTLAGGY